MEIIDIIRKTITSLEQSGKVPEEAIKHAKLLYVQGNCQMMSRGKYHFEFLVATPSKNYEFKIALNSETNDVHALQNEIPYSWDKYVIACLFQLLDELNWSQGKIVGKGIKYTKEGMMKRVLAERREKAVNANYTLEIAGNIYGEHVLINENGIRYKITLRDFESKTGYINSIDLRTNKLGTTKHLMWVFEKFEQEPELMEGLATDYPFVEIFLDPLNEYKITWFYPHEMHPDVDRLIREYFGDSHVFPENKVQQFLPFIDKAAAFPIIKVRDEVLEKIEIACEEQMLQSLSEKSEVNWKWFSTKLLPFQKEGVLFSTFKRGAIIADEIGLGKTLQAIATAVAKQKLLGFEKTLVVCPVSLKELWYDEITKICDLSVTMISGNQRERERQYTSENAFFTIASYETVVKDINIISNKRFDFIILDEAQKIKNYEAKTTAIIKSIRRKHALVLTESPIEEKLIELYSIVGFVDPYFLTPLWEFSYKHCLFDRNMPDKIVGYYNLTALKQRMSQIMVRRNKQSVVKQLPNINHVDVPVRMHPIQAQWHEKFSNNLRQLLKKKILNQYDIRKIFIQINNLRKVCNSPFLLDENINVAPKVNELQHILIERLMLDKSDKKMVVFSEWRLMNKLVASMLRQEGIPFVEINGSISQNNKKKLLARFSQLGSGTNILIATDLNAPEIDFQNIDYVVNLEVPWNIDKRNNRLGSLDKIINSTKSYSIINLVSVNSIETSIASGLIQKSHLFSGMFNAGKSIDFIDAENPDISAIIKEFDSAISKSYVYDELSFISPEFAPRVYETAEEINIHEGSVSAMFDMNGDKPVFSQEELEMAKKMLEHGLEYLQNTYKLSTGMELPFVFASVDVDEAGANLTVKLSKPTDEYA